MVAPERETIFSALYFVSFLAAVLMCALHFDTGESMLLCVSGFALILQSVSRDRG
jgi:hypothetical protein